MDRNQKVFLCAKSLMNISMDLKDDYKDFSDMLLFICDKISEREQKRERGTSLYTVHGEGNVHNLNCNCEHDEKGCSCKPDNEPISVEDQGIENEIDEMIIAVRKEMSQCIK